MERESLRGNNDRDYWMKMMCKIADPVLYALASQKLKIKMPLEAKVEDRDQYSYLEAFGRLVCGMAPWLETGPSEGEEGRLREKYADLVRRCIDAATNPESADFMNFTHGHQPIVDTAFLAHAIVRAPKEMWLKLEPRVQVNIVNVLKSTRRMKPFFSNWLLFSAMIEAALYVMGEEDWDRMRIDYALKQHDQWYLGDGIYGDGPEFRMDYYNSFVIQPMIVDVIELVGAEEPEWQEMKERVIYRAKRFAVVQERSISPEGTFPIIGRSLAYRFGAFQHLAQMALQGRIEESMEPAQVRCALTAVMKRMIEMQGTFDKEGWLRIGFAGHQPEIGERYISTGSLYLCATIFLPLGLPVDAAFWQGGSVDWTSKRAWSGHPIPIDYADKIN